MEDALKRVSAAVCLEAPRATGGVERRIIGGFWEVDEGRAWVVEKPYDVASEDILIFPSHQKPSKEWYQMEAPIDRGTDKKRVR